MIHVETVSAATLELLKELMQLPALEKFALVGWTNLSLRLGHRISIDLDLFTNEAFDSNKVLAALEEKYNVIVLRQTETSLACMISNVKVDVVLHEYPYLQPVEEKDGIRFTSLQDVVAMKLNAIAQRGAKKDFWDIAELLDWYPLETMLAFYSAKYSQQNVFFVLQALTYFDDADKGQIDKGEEVHSLYTTTRLKVKNKIKRAVDNYWKNKP